MPKCVSSWGSAPGAPDPAGGAHDAPPTPSWLGEARSRPPEFQPDLRLWKDIDCSY